MPGTVTLDLQTPEVRSHTAKPPLPQAPSFPLLRLLHLLHHRQRRVHLCNVHRFPQVPPACPERAALAHVLPRCCDSGGNTGGWAAACGGAGASEAFAGEELPQLRVPGVATANHDVATVVGFDGIRIAVDGVPVRRRQPHDPAAPLLDLAHAPDLWRLRIHLSRERSWPRYCHVLQRRPRTEHRKEQASIRAVEPAVILTLPAPISHLWFVQSARQAPPVRAYEFFKGSNRSNARHDGVNYEERKMGYSGGLIALVWGETTELRERARERFEPVKVTGVDFRACRGRRSPLLFGLLDPG